MEAEHVVAADALDDEAVAAGLMWVTRVATVALSRDHLKVAVPAVRRGVHLDAVELVLEALVAGRRRHLAGIGLARHGSPVELVRRAPTAR